MFSESLNACARACSTTRSPTSSRCSTTTRASHPTAWTVRLGATVDHDRGDGGRDDGRLLRAGPGATSDRRDADRPVPSTDATADRPGRQYEARYGTAAPARCGGPWRSSRPGASGAGPPPAVLGPRHHVRDPEGSPGRIRGSGSACRRAGAGDVAYGPLLALPALRALETAVPVPASPAGSVGFSPPRGRLRRGTQDTSRGRQHGPLQPTASARGQTSRTARTTTATRGLNGQSQELAESRALGTCQTLLPVRGVRVGRKEAESDACGSFCARGQFPGQGQGEALHRRCAPPRSPRSRGSTRSGWPSTTSCRTACARRPSPWPGCCSPDPAPQGGHGGQCVAERPSGGPRRAGGAAASRLRRPLLARVGRGGPWVDLEVFGNGLKAFEEDFPNPRPAAALAAREPRLGGGRPLRLP